MSNVLRREHQPQMDRKSGRSRKSLETTVGVEWKIVGQDCVRQQTELIQQCVYSMLSYGAQTWIMHKQPEKRPCKCYPET